MVPAGVLFISNSIINLLFWGWGMGNIYFPESISGQWIYLERFRNSADITLLMKRKFSFAGDSGDDPVFFVSANTSYQLYINGRLAGAGPRAHHNTGTSYIDAHEIGFYLEPGNNTILLFVHNCPEKKRGDHTRSPGMWCQLQCGGKTLLQSDESWELMALEGFNRPRVRVSEKGRLSTFVDLGVLPEKWNTGGDDSSGRWEKPDMLLLPGEVGALMELHPLPPAVIDPESLEFERVCRGRLGGIPGFSCCSFPENADGKTIAAVSYVFCDDASVLNVKFYADDPCKFFCNKNKLFDGSCARGQEISIPLKRGMNRLTLFAKPGNASMGVMFAAPDWPAELTFLSDMLDTAEPGWCVGTLSRLKYEECTPAVRIEALPDLVFSLSNLHSVNDIGDWLRNARLDRTETESDLLVESEWMLFKLPELHYGCLHFSMTAGAGDIVDMIVGTGCDENTFFLHCANGDDREVISCICREGENDMSAPVPSDCRYVLIYVRKTGTGVRVTPPLFDELSRNFNRECSFSCSEPFWNDLWKTGREALARSSVAIFPSDGCIAHDLYLLDSFFEAANVAAVFGDSGYITARLRQFAGGQLENGAIVSLASGSDYDPALFHMFFFPGWILYNYRFSGNMVEMHSLLPKLDAARKFLASLLDEEKFLLDSDMICEYSGAEEDHVVTCRYPVVMNALFCRFMISASEIYNLAERPFDAKECRHLLRHVSASLIENFFDEEAGLFADFPIKSKEDKVQFSLLGNFFPLFAGIKTQECFEKFVNTFFDFETGAARTVEAESPCFHYLFTEMLFALKQHEWGFRYLKNYWERRMDFAGAAWHDPVSGVIRTSRFANGNSVVPNVFLLREIIGVRLAEPAHSLIYFDPACDLVDHAEAAIPTVQGRIHISWKKQSDGGLEVNIYSSHPLQVMPEFPEEIIRKTTFSLSENVVLVKAASQEND